jgi:hypothetical protein
VPSNNSTTHPTHTMHSHTYTFTSTHAHVRCTHSHHITHIPVGPGLFGKFEALLQLNPDLGASDPHEFASIQQVQAHTHRHRRNTQTDTRTKTETHRRAHHTPCDTHAARASPGGGQRVRFHLHRVRRQPCLALLSRCARAHTARLHPRALTLAHVPGVPSGVCFGCATVCAW